MVSFGIPGSNFLPLLTGPVFGMYPGFAVSYICTLIGASLCYWISFSLGKDFVQRSFPDKLKQLTTLVEENRHNLLYYFIFLRATPIVPSWFLNLSTSLLGIPFIIFFSSMVIGILPWTFLLVKTGMTMSEASSLGFDQEVSLIILLTIIRLY